jgi:hypothetical protein
MIVIKEVSSLEQDSAVRQKELENIKKYYF